MIALDTNVLVRYIAQDDPVQSPQATQIIEDALLREEGVFIPLVVLCETVWVLRGYYKLAKQRIVHVLDAIITEKGFELEARVEIAKALADYRDHPGDFTDYVIGHIAKHHRCSTVFTFDHGLIKSPLFKIIEKP
jgi:predicted nucleic-acid-binding protein